MKNGKWLITNLVFHDIGSPLLRRRGKMKHWVARARCNSEWSQKGEAVIRSVHVFHRAIDEFIIKTRTQPRFYF